MLRCLRLKKGLKLDGTNDILKACVEMCKGTKATSKYSSPLLIPQTSITNEDCECPLCFKLMYKPCILTCGHSFCKACIERASDYDLRCPLCREDIVLQSKSAVGDSLTANIALYKLISRIYSSEYRIREEESFLVRERHQDRDLLFLLDCYVAPVGLNFPMILFEPRYKLFLRRCLEWKSSQFGIVYCPNECDEKDMGRVGVMLRITSHAVLADGRIIINTKSLYRFEIDSPETVDGYWIGRTKLLVDRPDSNATHDTPHNEDLKQSNCTSEAELQFYDGLFREIVFKYEVIWEQKKVEISSINSQYGMIPTPNDSSEYLSLWTISLLNVSCLEKHKLLCISNTLERFKRIYFLLQSDPNSMEELSLKSPN